MKLQIVPVFRVAVANVQQLSAVSMSQNECQESQSSVEKKELSLNFKMLYFIRLEPGIWYILARDTVSEYD